jgi:4-phospho-D-threonate 3-dehydrogenase / 4-phospho-D-erythronate 3-dehydrogenase
MEKPRIGISVGDINGVGLEVILKTVSDNRINQFCTPIIYGSSKVVSYHKNLVDAPDVAFQNLRTAERAATDKLNVVNCWQDTVNITLGKMTEEGGRYAIMSLDNAMEDLNAGHIEAIVTAPIHKKAMNMAGFQFTGHTEYLKKSYPDSKPLMLLVGDDMRVGLVTEHLPVSQIAAAITKAKVAEKIAALHQSLLIDFGIEKPTIAVLGLNPHAGDEGLIGSEDDQFIRPAIIEAKKAGQLVMGPFPADGFFGSGKHLKFDGILAMYHDQGLAPFKALNFGSGVNFTAGLPIVRTSPDHGTAFDIAGKNQANPESFRSALFLAIDIVRNRREYYDLKSNAIQRQALESEADDAPTQLDGY